MRIRTLHRRAALLTVAGALALAGPATPAFADPSGSPGTSGSASASGAAGSTDDASTQKVAPTTMADSEVDYWRGQLAGKLGGTLDPKPPRPYQKAKECVRRSSAGSSTDVIPWGQKVMRLNQLWSFGQQGAGEKIGVIDTGVSRHSRFDDRLNPAGDYVNQGDDGVADCDGHGTLVAGIIGADTQGGFSGVAPKATLFSIRTTSANYQAPDPNNPGGSQKPAGDLETMAAAIYTMIDQHHVNVINISLAACTPVSQATNQDLKYVQAAARYAVLHNVVIVAAAGNTDKDCAALNTPGHIQTISAPAWFDGDVLSVGSVGQSGDASSFTMAGPWVDVAAPGENITSLDASGRGLTNQAVDEQGRASPEQGTSFAAPYVTGLVALVREHFPKLTAREVMRRIIATSQHPAGDDGRNDRVGYGLVDPVAAMTSVLPEEQGISTAAVGVVHRPLPPVPAPDRLPITVALIGSGAGLGLLGLTLFVVYTIQRNRRPDETP